MNSISRKAAILISTGVIGIAAYQSVLRSFHSSFLQKDFVHGLWFGTFLGIEIFGIILFFKAKRQQSAFSPSMQPKVAPHGHEADLES